MRNIVVLWLLFILLANAFIISGNGGADGTGSGAHERTSSRAVTLIHDVYDLQDMSNDLDGSYELAKDIDASDTVNWNGGHGFEPVGNDANTFKGSLDGRNHTIRGLFIDRPDTDYNGLFGYIDEGGQVKNLYLVDGDVTGSNKTGGLAGFNTGTVDNSSATGDVTGADDVGGLVGYEEYGKVSSSYATGNVNGGLFEVAGLVGMNYQGTVIDSHATGNVTGSYVYVAGLVGYNYLGTVDNSYATGNVIGTGLEIGGLVGWNDGLVNNSYATGDVTGDVSVGGLVGFDGSVVCNSFATGNVTGNAIVGGLLGYNGHSIGDGAVDKSYAKGNVNGTSEVGGLAGRNDEKVNNSYATGNVNGESCVGGLVGNNSGGKVANSYAAGDVTGGSDLGGLVGSNGGTVSHSFWDTETSGQSESDGGTGKTTKEMKTRSTFTDAGWDFNYIWFMVENVTYPVFQWHNISFLAADAGIDQTVDQHAIVMFNGSGSRGGLQIINYTWTFTDRVPRTMYGVQPNYQFDEAGIFIVTLNITDSAASWGTDAVTVTVRDITAPAADAGPDQMVDDGTPVTLNGGGSSDNVGIVNYTWKFMDVVAVIVYDVQPEYLFDDPGVFLVTLNVTDAAGNWATDTMTVTVIDTIPPVADAGPDQEIDEGTRTMLDGSASHDNVGIVNYTWTFMDTARVNLYGVQPTYQFDFPGIFIATLNVTDATGNRATNTTTVTVDDIFAPVADAGPDQTVEVGTMVTFNGSGSSDTGGIVNYTWTFTDGMTITLNGARPAFKFDDPGKFVVTLAVKDAAGHRGTDTMTVTLVETIPPVNHPPAMISTPPTNATVGVEYIYNVKATDPDNDTLTFSLDNPPAEMTIDPSSGRLSWTPSVAGAFTVTVMVSDGREGSDNQSFNIMVSPGTPVCLITSPMNGSTVSGTINITGSAVKGTSPLERVEVRVDGGGWMQAAGLASWTLDFDTRTLTNGQHTIEARAFGGRHYSDNALVTTTVNNTQSRVIPPSHHTITINRFPWSLLLTFVIMIGIIFILCFGSRRGFTAAYSISSPRAPKTPLNP